MIKLRPAKDRFLGITENDCCELLGITSDQLKIARALDREKIERIRTLARCCSMDGNQEIIDLLSTLDDEKACDTEDKK